MVSTSSSRRAIRSGVLRRGNRLLWQNGRARRRSPLYPFLWQLTPKHEHRPRFRWAMMNCGKRYGMRASLPAVVVSRMFGWTGVGRRCRREFRNHWRVVRIIARNHAFDTNCGRGAGGYLLRRHGTRQDDRAAEWESMIKAVPGGLSGRADLRRHNVEAEVVPFWDRLDVPRSILPLGAERSFRLAVMPCSTAQTARPCCSLSKHIVSEIGIRSARGAAAKQKVRRRTSGNADVRLQVCTVERCRSTSIRGCAGVALVYGSWCRRCERHRFFRARQTREPCCGAWTRRCERDQNLYLAGARRRLCVAAPVCGEGAGLHAVQALSINPTELNTRSCRRPAGSLGHDVEKLSKPHQRSLVRMPNVSRYGSLERRGGKSLYNLYIDERRHAPSETVTERGTQVSFIAGVADGGGVGCIAGAGDAPVAWAEATHGCSARVNSDRRFRYSQARAFRVNRRADINVLQAGENINEPVCDAVFEQTQFDLVGVASSPRPWWRLPDIAIWLSRCLREASRRLRSLQTASENRGSN